MGFLRKFAGSDGPGRRAQPEGELLGPVPIAAVALLVVNDWVLKPAAWAPAILTGKLSDLAGLVFFPLLCTAVCDTVLLAPARLGAPVDFSLRPWKLGAACLGTAALFAAIKLSPGAADAVAGTLRTLGLGTRIVADPTDLVALPSVALAYWLGRREIARVPRGRIEVIERRAARGPVDVAAELEDVVRCGGEPEAVRALAAGLERYLDTGDPDDADAALARLRGA